MKKDETLLRYFHENVLRSYTDYKSAADKRSAGRGNDLYLAKKPLKIFITFENIYQVSRDIKRLRVNVRIINWYATSLMPLNTKPSTSQSQVLIRP
ncbi:MAG: hypothetical protein O9294_16820 [Cytophagales bacterium]|jgi:hypothetical protein|nr:hypothetical protein [Cytophagales bacterium]